MTTANYFTSHELYAEALTRTTSKWAIWMVRGLDRTFFCRSAQFVGLRWQIQAHLLSSDILDGSVGQPQPLHLPSSDIGVRNPPSTPVVPISGGSFLVFCSTRCRGLVELSIASGGVILVYFTTFFLTL
jgi:hypothetical protein